MKFDVAGCWRFGAIGCFVNTRNQLVSFSTCKHPRGTAKHHTPVCKLDDKPVPATTSPIIATTEIKTEAPLTTEAVTEAASTAAAVTESASTAAAETEAASTAAVVTEAVSTAAAGTEAASTAAPVTDNASTAAAETEVASTAPAVVTESPSTAAAKTEVASTAAAVVTESPSTAAATSGAPPAAKFKLGTAGSAACPQGYSVVTDQQECKQQITAWTQMKFDVAGCWRFEVVGCFINTRNKKVSFSTCAHPTGTPKDHTPVCKLDTATSAPATTTQ